MMEENLGECVYLLLSVYIVQVKANGLERLVCRCNHRESHVGAIYFSCKVQKTCNVQCGNQNVERPIILQNSRNIIPRVKSKRTGGE